MSNTRGTWAIGEPMPEGRACYAYATVGKKIYYSGGYTSNGYVNSNTIVIYDIATDTWSAGPDIPIDKRFHSCTAVASKIYFTGGASNGVYSTDVHILDTETNTWSTGGKMSSARWYHDSVAVGNKIYCIGGSDNISTFKKIIDIYDTETNTWSTATSTVGNTNTTDLTCVAVGSKIFCVCGRVKNPGGNLDLYIYDTEKEIIEGGPPIATYDEYPGCATIGKMLYIITNKGLHIFDTVNNLWISGLQYQQNGGYYICAVDDKLYATHNNSYNQELLIFTPAPTSCMTMQYQTQKGTNIATKTAKLSYHDEEFSTEPVHIENYTCVGYKINNGEILNLQNNQAVIASVNSDLTITFIYALTNQLVTINEKYLDESNVAVHAETTSQLQQNNTYKKTSPIVAGYTRIGYKIDGGTLQNGKTATISAVGAAHTVEFIYKLGEEPVEAFTITEKYQSESGNSLNADTTTNVNSGDNYSKSALTISDYTCIGYKVDGGTLQNESTATIQNVQANNTVIFVYKPSQQTGNSFTITEKYQSESGNSLNTDTTTNVNSGDNYAKSAPNISGYVCTGYKVDGGLLQNESTATIQNVQANHTVIFVYKPSQQTGNSFTITEKYQSESGNSLNADTTTNVNAGSNYAKSAPNISGYVCTGYKIDGGTLQNGNSVSIQNVQANHTAVFIYKFDSVTEINPNKCKCCCGSLDMQLHIPITSNAEMFQELSSLVAAMKGCGKVV